MMKNLVVASNADSVGKTTIASQITYFLSERGHSVMGIDLDGQRDFTSSFSSAIDLGSALDLVLDGKPINADLVARRNRVMQTYSAAAAVLAQSPDPEDRALVRRGASQSCISLVLPSRPDGCSA